MLQPIFKVGKFLIGRFILRGVAVTGASVTPAPAFSSTVTKVELPSSDFLGVVLT